MLYHRRRILSLLLQAESAHHISLISLRCRLLSTKSAVSPKPFAVEDYLVATWGLTRAQARKASKKLSHLKSPSKPDAVHAFLSDLGLPPPIIAAVAATDPQFLCANVSNNLARRVEELGGLGLSRSQIASLLPLARSSFRCSSLGMNLGFWLQVVGSFDKILKKVKNNSALLGSDLEKVVKPNLKFLEQCGMNNFYAFSYATRLFTLYPEYLRDAAVRAEELGLDPNSRMFRRGLAVVASIKKETVASKIRLLEELGFSQDDTLSIIRKSPNLLALTEGKIRQAMELFKREIGLEERYIAQRPVLFLYGLERRLLPRYCLLNVLRAKGLMVKKSDYYNTASMAERKFVQRFVDPYKDLIPGLADAYASSCSGKAKNGFASLLAV